MSIHDTDFTRRLRSVASPPAPPRSTTKRSHYSRERDIFGDVEQASPRGMSPKLKGKGKAVVRDYGDRYVVSLPPMFVDTTASSQLGMEPTFTRPFSCFPTKEDTLMGQPSPACAARMLTALALTPRLVEVRV